MDNSKKVRHLNVLFIQEEGCWVAQCLEYDVAAQGVSFEDAQLNFEQTFIFQLMAYWDIHEDPFEVLERAPEEFWEMHKNTLHGAEDRSIR